MALKWDQSERSQNFRYKVTAVFVRGLFSKFFPRCGERWQMRCRLILLITEHPIQQGIRKVKSSLLANLRSSLVANYWTVRKCLFSMCFSPFSAIFFAFTPFKYTHNTNFEKKCSPGLDFLSTVKAQTFCRNSRRVATAYSTDKYKYQNMKIRVSWVGQSTKCIQYVYIPHVHVKVLVKCFK